MLFFLQSFQAEVLGSGLLNPGVIGATPVSISAFSHLGHLAGLKFLQSTKFSLPLPWHRCEPLPEAPFSSEFLFSLSFQLVGSFPWAEQAEPSGRYLLSIPVPAMSTELSTIIPSPSPFSQ